MATVANVVRKGYLNKRGKQPTSWKKRYFVLFSDGKLAYYKQPPVFQLLLCDFNSLILLARPT